MEGYRLMIDVPLGTDIKEAKKEVDNILVTLQSLLSSDVPLIQYKLIHDQDRGGSNYLIQNKNGHNSSKKCKITLQDADYDVQDDS